MARVVHFEISADNPERAVKFYSEIFGWQINKWDGPSDYSLASTGEGPGIDGAIMRRGEGMPPVVNTIDVLSLDDAIEQITARGGAVMMPRMTVPGVGYLAYCSDTESNMFGLMQADPNATA